MRICIVLLVYIYIYAYIYMGIFLCLGGLTWWLALKSGFGFQDPTPLSAKSSAQPDHKLPALLIWNLKEKERDRGREGEREREKRREGREKEPITYNHRYLPTCRPREVFTYLPNHGRFYLFFPIIMRWAGSCNMCMKKKETKCASVVAK